MKKSKLARVLALAVAFAMCVAVLASCSQAPAKTESTASASASDSSAESTASASASESVEETAKSDTPLVVGYAPFSQKFSPFVADTAYDQDVVSMTQVSPLTTDRAGGIIYNGIEGETVSYNGTDYTYYGLSDITVDQNDDGSTTYTMKLRDDVTFSDGEPLTADDLIFTYYTYADPSYVGSTTLSSYGIKGLKDYQTQTTSEIYEKYAAIFDAISANDTSTATEEQATWVSDKMLENWRADAQGIVDYVYANYAADYAEAQLGKTAEEIGADDNLKAAFAMVMWGFGSYADGVVTGGSTGTTWDIAGGTSPTFDEYFSEIVGKYSNDPAAYVAAGESASGTDIVANTKAAFISEFGPKDESMTAGGVPNISGIVKVDDYTVSVTTEGFEAPAIYTICGIQVAPLHYYGDKTKYDYANNKFGFDFGDLSVMLSKTTQPLGAGPYKFVKYENKIVYFEANETYYKGAPKIATVQFKEGDDADKVPGVGTGTLDVSDPSFSTSAVDEIKSYNSNGELDGDKIVTNTVDNLGYGYIGLNADTINVGGNASSDQSKDLRKAFATVISQAREVAIDSYYGDRASVINYPISNTSWAAPQKTDADYKVAFSTALDGSDVYTADMDNDKKAEAALAAAVDYLKAAGFTYDDATGKFTAAPAGAKLDYEILIPADGKGDHPSFMICTLFKQQMEKIGITINVNDLSDSSVLWDKLDSGSQEMWCAAWGATIDPDMYQVYHSSGIIGRGGSDSNHYHIDDAELDKLIVDARASGDQAYRKSVYKACLDIIIDWAVEIPVYQRQNCIIFSSERVNMDTVTPDITTFYGWMAEIEKMEMK